MDYIEMHFLFYVTVKNNFLQFVERNEVELLF
jgi:hypothetical protein